MQQKLAEGVDLSENAQALDAIREVGPGSHYLGCAHTQANFQTAFYRSPLADNNSFEQWEIEGEKRAAARQRARRTLARKLRGAPSRSGDRRRAAGLRLARSKESMPDAFT
jgi:trimethylamine--corrinoid protein Co-methyltransferase